MTGFYFYAKYAPSVPVFIFGLLIGLIWCIKWIRKWPQERNKIDTRSKLFWMLFIAFLSGICFGGLIIELDL